MPGNHLKEVLYRKINLALCLLAPVFSYAQIDSAVNLHVIEVTASRINLSDIGKHTEKIDSQTLATRYCDHLGALLAQQTPLFVRSYGSGTLATLGIRGGSASHTQILWNGIPLRNPMLGLVDLALLPVTLIDEASVHYGGHGAAFGSGAVGGLISITNNRPDNGMVKGNFGIGSWGRREASLQIDYGFPKLWFSTKMYHQRADNNYLYRLGKDLPLRRQVHHRLKNNGVFQEISWNPSSTQNLDIRLWYQYTDRQIPPTSTQTTSKTAQQDAAFRASAQWNLVGDKFNWQIKSAWLDEVIDFQDTLILLYTNNRFKTWLAEGDMAWQINEQMQFTGGLYTEIAAGLSDNYERQISRHQTAAFGSWSASFNHWILRLQAREEITAGSLSPVLLDLSTEWNALHFLSLKGSLSRNYRMPTLNDLHWRPGGNEFLLPEQGWTLESGAHLKSANEIASFNATVTAYSRRIQQWIMWMPPIKGFRNYWSPVNIAEVYSRGVETRMAYSRSFHKLHLKVHGGADFTWSTFETPLPEFNIEAGEQLFYVPVENISGGMTITYKDHSIYYDHHWFGNSTGINDRIEASSVGTAGMAISFGSIDLKGTLYVRIENIWDTPYRIIERRPMPGRTFMTGFKFLFD